MWFYNFFILQAFQRRASARTGLGKYELAVDDYDQVLKHEPTNKAAQNEKTKLIEKIKNIKEINENPDSKKQNFDNFADKMKGAFKPSSAISQELLGVKSNKIQILERGLVLPIDKPAHKRSTKALKRIEIKEVASVKSSATPNAQIQVSKSSGITKKIEREISADLSKVEIVNTIPGVPKSSSKFLSDWKSVKTIVNRSKYLQQFKSADYLSVFKTSLDGGIFRLE